MLLLPLSTHTHTPTRRSMILERCLKRLEWDRARAREAQALEDELERERVAMQQVRVREGGVGGWVGATRMVRTLGVDQATAGPGASLACPRPSLHVTPDPRPN